MKRFLGLGFFLTYPLIATSVSLVPMKSYKELESVPPQLEVTFSLECYQKAARIIRHEIVNEKTGEIEIYIGLLIENSTFICQAPPEDINFIAGTTFAGLNYKVLPIALEEQRIKN